MSKELESPESWEPSSLREYEKKAREQYTAEDFDWGDDFGSYKAINEGVILEKSGLIHHNLYKAKYLIEVVSEYIHILKYLK